MTCRNPNGSASLAIAGILTTALVVLCVWAIRSLARIAWRLTHRPLR